MPRYEYKVVPAPTKGLKAKGVKGPEARFSHAIQELMNGLAGYGWEYQRAETLPSIERAGLTSTTTEWRNVLVFRRLRDNDAEAFSPELLPPPDLVQTAPPAVPMQAAGDAAPEPVSDEPKPEGADAAQAPQTEARKPEASERPAAEQTSSDEVHPRQPEGTDTDDGFDNGVEDTSDVAGVGTTLEQLAAARKGSKTDA